MLCSGNLSATSSKGECDALPRGHTLVSLQAQSGDTVRRHGDISSLPSSPSSMSRLFRWLCYSRALGKHLTCSENMLHTNSHQPQKHFCKATSSSPNELPNITHTHYKTGESPVTHSLVVTLHPSLFKSSTTHLAPTLCSQLFFG